MQYLFSILSLVAIFPFPSLLTALHCIALRVWRSSLVPSRWQRYKYSLRLYYCIFVHTNMDQPFKQETAWDPSADQNLSPASPTERRHSSSASSSTLSTNDSNDSSGSRGRRSRPSVASVSSQLPTVREKNLQRAISEEKLLSLSQLSSEETVVSSQKVNIPDAASFFSLTRARSTGLNQF